MPPVAAPRKLSDFGPWIWILPRERPDVSAREIRNDLSRSARARSRRSLVYLAKDRPALIARSPRNRDRFRREIGPAIVSRRPLADRQAPRTFDRLERRREPAHPEAQFCHPSPGRRRRPPGGAGNARPCVDRDHADLHPRRAQPSPRSSFAVSSPQPELHRS